jgi:chaperonin GroES
MARTATAKKRQPTAPARKPKAAKLNLRPLGDKVVVQSSEEEERTAGGIYLPDTAKEKPQEGKVVAVGPGRLTPEGKKLPMNVKVGDTVIFAKYSGTKFTIEGEEYLILDEDSIYAIRE